MLLIYFVYLLYIVNTALCDRCQNGYYNGQPCATTTNYVIDPNKGVACGCDYDWETQYFTAAGNCNLMGHSDGDKCDSAGCGKCYRLTTTGDTPPGSGSNTAGESIVVMLTNVCPEEGNDQWCVTYGTNRFGYQYHFDIAKIPKFVALGWSNPIVTFEQVACGTDGSAGIDQYSNCKWAGAFPEFNGSTTVMSPSGSPESSVSTWTTGPAVAPPTVVTYSNGTCDCTCHAPGDVPSPNFNPPTPSGSSNPPSPTGSSNPPSPTGSSNPPTPQSSSAQAPASVSSTATSTSSTGTSPPSPVSPPDVSSNFGRAQATLGGSSLALWQQCGGKSGSICGYFNCLDSPWSGFSCQTGSCQRLQQWYWQCRD